MSAFRVMPRAYRDYFEIGETIHGAGTPGHNGHPTWIPNIDHEGRMCHLHLTNIELDGPRHYHAIVAGYERVHPNLTHAEEAALYGGSL